MKDLISKRKHFIVMLAAAAVFVGLMMGV